jgi:hypothetical protein
MFFYCSSWPPVRISRFRPFFSYIENPWAPGHIPKGVVGMGGSIPALLRGAMMHSMNFRTSKQNFCFKLCVEGGGHSTPTYCDSWSGCVCKTPVPCPRATTNHQPTRTPNARTLITTLKIRYGKFSSMAKNWLRACMY